MSDSLRPVTHCCSGSLYGITETLPADLEGLVTPTIPAGVRAATRFGQNPSIYQVYDLRGNRRGEVDMDGHQNLTDAVAKAFPGPGIFLARQAGQAGNAQKIVVAAPKIVGRGLCIYQMRWPLNSRGDSRIG